MSVTNILEAKTNLSRLVEAIESGAKSEIILARNGKPVARLVPLAKVPASKRIGLLDGKFKAPKDFDADNDAVVRLFGKHR
jgi:antitoxin (DNA-binding transcriptional repressor) of toxin-antitoxin stability system